MVSNHQLILSVCFYLILIVITIIQFSNTDLNSITFIIMPLLLIEWWQSWCYFLTIKGEFALFHYIDQIYWHHQRWYLMRKPLLLRYVIILNLKSRRNGKRRTLFLISSNFKPDDWRTLHYYLHQIEFTNK